MSSLDRSASTGSLRQAGSQFLAMTHVPKRATQHSCFLPTYEVLPPQLKCGQASLQRQVYAEEAKTLRDTYLEPDRATKSMYQAACSFATPQDYEDPDKPFKPTEPVSEGGHRGCAHWISDYKASHGMRALEGRRYHRQIGPSYQAVNPPTCVSGPIAKSQFQFEHGKHGENPRHKFRLHSSKNPVIVSALTYGTPKGTLHMPGYSGFLPTNTSNALVRAHEQGATLRTTTDKVNIAEQCTPNKLGYTGHQPTNAVNSRGPVSHGNVTTFGRSFSTPSFA